MPSGLLHLIGEFISVGLCCSLFILDKFPYSEVPLSEINIDTAASLLKKHIHKQLYIIVTTVYCFDVMFKS